MTNRITQVFILLLLGLLPAHYASAQDADITATPVATGPNTAVVAFSAPVNVAAEGEMGFDTSALNPVHWRYNGADLFGTTLVPNAAGTRVTFTFLFDGGAANNIAAVRGSLFNPAASGGRTPITAATGTGIVLNFRSTIFWPATAPVATIAAAALTEATLDGATVTVTLQNSVYDEDIAADDFTLALTAGATGVSVSDVSRDSPTAATLTLAYDDTDITATTNLSVTVLAAAHIGADNLATGNVVTITPSDTATISAPPDTSIPIAETALNGTTLTVTLENTEYETSPTAGQFTLNLSAGTGVTVSNVARDSATAATLTLAYGGSGIDANTRIGVTVAGAAHTGAGDLTTDNMLRVAATAPSFAGMQPIANQTYLANSAITDLTLPAASGGEGALSYTLAPTGGGSLPNGLVFDADTRVLSGTPDTEQAATGYTYTVTAGDGNTATIGFTIEVLNLATGLTAVRDLVATERRGRVVRIALTWLPPATVPAGTSVSSYEIQGCSAADTDCVAFITSNHVGAAGDSQSATLFRATFNFYRVRARTTAGVSPWANVARTVDPGVVVDPGTLPSMVQNLASSARADNSVTLTWEAPTDATSTAVNRYVVVRGFPAETATLGAFAPPGAEAVVTLADDVFTYADSGLLPGTEYLYEVFASSNAGDGEVAQLLVTTTGTLTTSIAGVATGTITEGATAPITGRLTITTTSGNSEFVPAFVPVDPTLLGGFDGAYGVFAIGTDGVWTYSLNYNLPRVRALTEGASVEDMFTVTAAAPTADGVAVTQVVTITITGVNTRPNAAIRLVEGSTVAAGETLRLESDITDPDNELDDLTIAWTAAGGIGTFSAAASADTDWMVPAATPPGEYLLTLTVTDPGGAFDTEQVSITVTEPVTVNLQVTALTFPGGMTSLTTGATAALTATTQNLSTTETAASGDWRVNVYRTTTPATDAADRIPPTADTDGDSGNDTPDCAVDTATLCLAATRSDINLNPETSDDIGNFMVTIPNLPDPVDAYHYFACAIHPDDLTRDNDCTPSTTQVTVTAGDLTILSAPSLPTSLNPGQTINDVSVTVTNQGNGAAGAAWFVNFFRTMTLADAGSVPGRSIADCTPEQTTLCRVHSFNGTAEGAIAAGDVFDVTGVTFDAPAPSTLGTYYYFACVAVSSGPGGDFDRTNQCGTQSEALQVTVAGPILTIAAPTGEDTGTLRFTVSNAGTAAAANTVTFSVYRTEQPVDAAQANTAANTAPLCSVTASTPAQPCAVEQDTDITAEIVATTGTYDGTAGIAPPADSTDYSYFVCVTTSANTRTCSPSGAVVNVPGPNLSIAAPTGENTDTLRFTVSNAGTAVAADTATFSVYRAEQPVDAAEANAAAGTAPLCSATESTNAQPCAAVTGVTIASEITSSSPYNGTAATNTPADVVSEDYYYFVCVTITADSVRSCSPASALVEVTDLRFSATPAPAANPTTVPDGDTFTITATVENGGNVQLPRRANFIAYEAPTTLATPSPLTAASLVAASAVDVTPTLAQPPILRLSADTSAERTIDVDPTEQAVEATLNYFLCIEILDSDINVENNCTGPLAVVVQAPPTIPDVSATSTLSGTTLTALVSNTGVDATGASVEYYRSLTERVAAASPSPEPPLCSAGGDDAAICRLTAAAASEDIARGDSDRAVTPAVTITPPTTPGDYYYFVCVTHVDDIIKDNDCGPSQTLNVARLTIAAPTGEDTGTLAFTVNNAGVAVAANTATFSVYRTEQPVNAAQADTAANTAPLCSVTESTNTQPCAVEQDTAITAEIVATTGTYDGTAAINPPADSTDYSYFVCVTTSDSVRSCSPSGAVVNVPAPILTIAAPTGEDTDTLAFTVSNTGGAAAANTVTFSVYRTEQPVNAAQADTAANTAPLCSVTESTNTQPCAVEQDTAITAEIVATTGTYDGTAAINPPADSTDYSYFVCVTTSAGVRTCSPSGAVVNVPAPILTIAAPTGEDTDTLRFTVSNTGGAAAANTVTFSVYRTEQPVNAAQADTAANTAPLCSVTESTNTQPCAVEQDTAITAEIVATTGTYDGTAAINPPADSTDYSYFVCVTTSAGVRTCSPSGAVVNVPGPILTIAAPTGEDTDTLAFTVSNTGAAAAANTVTFSVYRAEQPVNAAQADTAANTAPLCSVTASTNTQPCAVEQDTAITAEIVATTGTYDGTAAINPPADSTDYSYFVCVTTSAGVRTCSPSGAVVNVPGPNLSIAAPTGENTDTLRFTVSNAGTAVAADTATFSVYRAEQPVDAAEANAAAGTAPLCSATESTNAQPCAAVTGVTIASEITSSSPYNGTAATNTPADVVSEDYYYFVCVTITADSVRSCSPASALVEVTDLRFSATPAPAANPTTVPDGATFRISSAVENGGNVQLSGRATFIVYEAPTTLATPSPLTAASLDAANAVDVTPDFAQPPIGRVGTTGQSLQMVDVDPTLQAADTTLNYFLCIEILDSDINVENNCTGPLAVLVQAPPTIPDVSATSTLSGTTLTALVSNTGVDATGASVEYYRSLTERAAAASPSPEPPLCSAGGDDAAICRLTAAAASEDIARGDSDRAVTPAVTITPPTTPGDYYYFVCVTHADDIIKDNDCGPSQTLNVALQPITINAATAADTAGAVTEDDVAANTATGTLTIDNPNPSGNTAFVAIAADDPGGTGTYGTFTIAADTGVWTYTLDNAADDTNALAANEMEDDVFTVVAAADDTVTQEITITITGANDAPDANAGTDQTVALSATVTLDGSASADPDTADAIDTYTWTQSSGTSVSLSDTAVARPTFTAPNSAADLEFSLMVSDGDLDSAADTVTITVTAAPTATISATNPASLTEANLNAATLTVTLINTTYQDPLPANSIMLNAGATTAGVTATAARVSDTEATLTLAFDRASSDFDTNLDITVTVLDAAHTGVGDLLTASVTVEAIDESDVATLAGLTLSGSVPLNETFAPATLTYTADVANDVTDIMVTPTATDDVGATITVDGTAVNSGAASVAIALTAGGATPITVVVTAEDRSTTQTYTLTVTRAAATTPSAAIASPDSLTEAALDGATVTVMLTNTEYVGTLVANLFTVTLSGGATGVSVNTAVRTSAVLATLTLAYGGTGIDTNTNLGIRVGAAGHSGAGNLDTATTIPVTATPPPGGALSFGGVTIDAQTYTANTAITDLTLPAATGGTGTLSYALSDVPSGLSFNAMTRVLSGTPDMEQMATTYTYTATDSAPSPGPAAVTLELVVTVGPAVTGGPIEGARSEAMEMTLGAFGRSFASGAVDVLGERFSSGAGGSQLTFGGRTLSLESLRNGQAAAGDVPDNQPVPASAGGQQTSVGALFVGSAFQLSLNEGDAAGVGATTLWARGAVGNYEGEPEDGFQLDGDIVSGYLGLDYRANRRTLVGVAVSHSRGEADFSSADIADGEVETELTSILPYVQWQARPGLSVWGLVGYGLGESEITDSGESRKTDVEMQTAALGARGKLWSGGRADVALKASALTVELESDSEQNLSSVTTRAHRLRMALAGKRHGAASARGGRFGQRFELGLRWDLGDVETGAGADLGAGVEYANPRSGTRLRLDGHYLLVHEESDFEAWEVSAEVGIAPSLWGRGVRFALEPGWDSAGARQRMVMDFTDVLGPAWRGDGLKLELYGEHAEDHEFGLEGSVRY